MTFDTVAACFPLSFHAELRADLSKLCASGLLSASQSGGTHYYSVPEWVDTAVCRILRVDSVLG